MLHLCDAASNNFPSHSTGQDPKKRHWSSRTPSKITQWSSFIRVHHAFPSCQFSTGHPQHPLSFALWLMKKKRVSVIFQDLQPTRSSHVTNTRERQGFKVIQNRISHTLTSKKKLGKKNWHNEEKRIISITHRLTSCFIRRILASLGQHFLLL